MKLVLPLAAVVALLSPSVALACPYGSSACGSCGSSLLHYGASVLVGLGIGVASVAFQRRPGSTGGGPKTDV